MNLNQMLPVIAALAAVFALACSGGDDDAMPVSSPTVAGTIVRPAGSTSVPSPSATLGTAPSGTPTPVVSAEQQAKSLKLLEVPTGLLQWVTDGPYVVPGDALGAFYLDIETQQIEGWFDLIGDTQPVAFSAENRYTVFERQRQATRGGQLYEAGYYLADRQSNLPYRWTGDAELVYEKTGRGGNEITARGDLVLFRTPVEDGGDWYTLLNTRTNMVEATFQAEGTWGLISHDGNRVALAGEDIYVVDLDDGSVEKIATGAFSRLVPPGQPAVAEEQSEVELMEDGEGDSFLVAVNPVTSNKDAAWARYEWTGDLVGKGTGATAYLSADGEHVAVAERLPESAPGTPWHSLEALGTEDGKPSFRVIGVDERFVWPEHQRWLADGSGLIVQTPDNSLRLATEDGELHEYVGVPSPTEMGVFAELGGPTGTVGAVDADGKPIVSISFQGGVRDFVDPWGESGDEVRFLIPHGGHDGPPATATIVQPYVEEAPYEGTPRLQISDLGVAFGLLDLYEEPGSDTVVGRVAAPYRVTVEEFAMRCSGNGYSDPQDCPKTESSAPYHFIALVLGSQISEPAPVTSYWARIVTADGQEGWLLLQANVQGI